MAGTVKVNTIQLGDSGTASQNFVLSIPAVPDGTIKLSRGNVGATTQDVLSVANSTGVVTLTNGLASIPAVTGSFYETGPVVGMTATGTAGTFAVSNPYYTKIGNSVTVWGAITCSVGGSTTNMTVAGFPFTNSLRTSGIGKENAVNGQGFMIDVVGTTGYLSAYDGAARTWATNWVVAFSVTYKV